MYECIHLIDGHQEYTNKCLSLWSLHCKLIDWFIDRSNDWLIKWGLPYLKIPEGLYKNVSLNTLSWFIVFNTVFPGINVQKKTLKPVWFYESQGRIYLVGCVLLANLFPDDASVHLIVWSRLLVSNVCLVKHGKCERRCVHCGQDVNISVFTPRLTLLSLGEALNEHWNVHLLNV